MKYSVDDVLLSNPFCDSSIVKDEETSMLLDCDDIICFVVGGTQFQIMKSKFAYWPQTRLSKLIRAKTESEKSKLCDKFVVSKERKMMMQTYIFFRNGNNFN